MTSGVHLARLRLLSDFLCPGALVEWKMVEDASRTPLDFLDDYLDDPSGPPTFSGTVRSIIGGLNGLKRSTLEMEE